MKKNQQSIDGFTPRRRTTETIKKTNANLPAKPAKVSPRREKVADNLEKINTHKKIEAEDVNEALANLEIEDSPAERGENYRDSKKARKEAKLQKKFAKFNTKREKRGKAKLSLKQFKRKRLARKVGLVLFLALILAGGFFAYQKFNNSGLAGGNLIDAIIGTKAKLKTDSKGRTNILIFGTSPKGWDGEDLADSVMVVSANQETGKSYTISLPRDLYVKHTCSSWLGTTSGKLNETFGCGYYDALNSGASEQEAEKAGQQALAKTATEVLGLDIQYVVHGNWQVVIDTVNAVGGIDVLVEAYDGSARVYDVATKINYKSGETYHMDGATALAFSRARGSEGGVGLSNSNFDRERNQQKIIKATLEKISQQKMNPAALIGIANSLGNNINTSFEYSELQTAAGLAQSFTGSKMISIPLINDEDSTKSFFTTGSVGGVSAVIPKAGTYEYGKIKVHINKTTLQNEVTEENAKIVILNGTSISGLAAEQQTKLEADGYNIADIDSAPTTDYEKTTIYVINSKKTATIKKLETRYGAKASTKLPSGLASYKETADIVIVVGMDK